MEENNLSNLLNVLHFSSPPNISSKKRETFLHDLSTLMVYLSPHEYVTVYIKDLFKKYKNQKIFTLDKTILKISSISQETVLLGSVPFFITLGSQVSIVKVGEHIVVDILYSKNFSLQEWGENLEDVESLYLKSWSSWYLRLNGRVQVKSVNGDLEPTRDQMISTILEVESNLIKNKETSNHFRKKDLANNIENCRFYLENYLKTKDLKYLIEGYVRE